MTRGSIAVVIPCYNGERFIAETIESVLAQTRCDDIVVVDDGSTDGTAGVVARYQPRVRLLRHPGGVNRGLAASRNLGIEQTTADYLAFLDADDLWQPDKLALEADVLDHASDVGIVVSRCRAIDSDSRPLYDFAPFPEFDSRVLAEELLVDCFIQTPGQALIRRSLIEQYGVFDPQPVAAEDHDFWIRMAERTTFRFLPHVTVDYRKHATSMSNAGAKRMWESGFVVLANAERRRDYGLAARRRRGVLNFRLAQCAWIDGDYLRAAAHGVRAAASNPGRALRELMHF